MNWSPSQDHVNYKVATPVPGKWRVCLDSDAWDFGGRGRVAHEADHFSQPSKEKFHDRFVCVCVGGGGGGWAVFVWGATCATLAAVRKRGIRPTTFRSRPRRICTAGAYGGCFCVRCGGGGQDGARVGVQTPREMWCDWRVA
eukprot:361975-Chlamydomonas_euryale.AAC.8